MNAKPSKTLRNVLSSLAAAVVVLGLTASGVSALDLRAQQAVKPVRISLPIPKELSQKKGPTYQEEVSTLANSLSSAYKIPNDRATNFADWILQATTYSDVPNELLAGLIMTESTFEYYSVSNSGAVGPGQLKPKYWNKRCPQIKNPKNNVMCAATVLRHYYDDYCNQDWQCALKTYNVGPASMKKNKGRQASNRYVKKVNNHMQLLANVQQFNKRYPL